MTNGNGLAIRQLTAVDAPACDEVVRSLPYHFEASSEITWMAVHAGHRDRGVGVSLVAFAVLGAGLLGPATPGGFRDNDLAAVATCFGVLALVSAYASYRSMRR